MIVCGTLRLHQGYIILGLGQQNTLSHAAYYACVELRFPLPRNANTSFDWELTYLFLFLDFSA